MNVFWNLILVAFFTTNSLEKAESVQLEETPLKIIDEIFGEGWWDNAKDVEWQKLTLDRQNTQLGQVEPNSTDRDASLTESDHSGQIEPNSTDQNASLTESDHSENAKNGVEQNEISEKIEKRKIIDEFDAIKDKFKQKGKHSTKEWVQIEREIAKHLNVSRSKIYKWKKELGLSRKMHNYGKEKNERKHLIEKFDQMKAELTRDGFKNSYKEINGTVAKGLGLSFMTIYRWKNEIGQTKPQHKHSDSEQKELMKRYYKIKGKNSKIIDQEIAKMLKIGLRTLCKWKKQFKEQ